jgi:hypothetical protein
MGPGRSIEECRALLRRSGWSAEEARVLAQRGDAWTVTISKGDTDLRSHGATAGEAWRKACRMAQVVDHWRG